MGKNIGILTFLRTLNYGALLQAYALQQVLSRAGFDNELIDYRNKKIENFEFRRANTLKGRLVNIWKARHIDEKARAFEDFLEQKMTISPSFDRGTVRTCADRYDAIVVGSDQVWNPACTGSDPSFFLDFIDDSAKKKSYAASIGQSSLPKGSALDFEVLLGDFSNVLVREKTAAEVIKRICPKITPEVVLDPTLLATKDIWTNLVPSSSPLSEKYVFVYSVGERVNCIRIARDLAKKFGYRIVHVQQNSANPTFGAVDLYAPSPTVFLNYLAHSECVVTSSFHGVCFSLQFERPFVVSLPGGPNARNSRMTDLLDLLQIRGQTTSSPQFDGSLEVEYRHVNELLATERTRSQMLLLKSLTADIAH